MAIGKHSFPARLLSALKEAQSQHRSEALKPVSDNIEFNFGLRCGKEQGFSYAIELIEKLLKDDESDDGQFL